MTDLRRVEDNFDNANHNTYMMNLEKIKALGLTIEAIEPAGGDLTAEKDNLIRGLEENWNQWENLRTSYHDALKQIRGDRNQRGNVSAERRSASVATREAAGQFANSARETAGNFANSARELAGRGADGLRGMLGRPTPPHPDAEANTDTSRSSVPGLGAPPKEPVLSRLGRAFSPNRDRPPRAYSPPATPTKPSARELVARAAEVRAEAEAEKAKAAKEKNEAASPSGTSTRPASPISPSAAAAAAAEKRAADARDKQKAVTKAKEEQLQVVGGRKSAKRNKKLKIKKTKSKVR
jgi:hypothetical protein